jgi:exodeoxyribonuclease VII small subunit
VANPPKTTGNTKSALTFEDALTKLEGIVERMEGDDLPLEQLLAQYEEGVKLAKVCQDKLADAEVKIQQLEQTAGGELKLKPLAEPSEM